MRVVFSVGLAIASIALVGVVVLPALGLSGVVLWGAAFVVGIVVAISTVPSRSERVHTAGRVYSLDAARREREQD